MSCACVQVIVLFEPVSNVVRDVLKFILFLDVKLVLTNIILKTICQLYNQTIWDMLHEILQQIIFI